MTKTKEQVDKEAIRKIKDIKIAKEAIRESEKAIRKKYGDEIMKEEEK